MKSHDVNSDRAYEYIRKRILNGEYKPGQRLMAKGLAAKRDISPTPVRDALRQLEADRLVTIRPRLGAQVNAMGLKDFRELCELRLLLESHIAGLAAERRTAPELREIEVPLIEMRRITTALLEGDSQDARLMSQLVRVDIQFHIAIMSAARNELIRTEILRLHLINRVVSGPMSGSSLATSGQRGQHEAHLRQVLKDHELIFETIRRQDAPAARAAMEASIQDVINQTLQFRAREERDLIARELTEELVTARA